MIAAAQTSLWIKRFQSTTARVILFPRHHLIQTTHVRVRVEANISTAVCIVRFTFINELITNTPATAHIFARVIHFTTAALRVSVGLFLQRSITADLRIKVVASLSTTHVIVIFSLDHVLAIAAQMSNDIVGEETTL